MVPIKFELKIPQKELEDLEQKYGRAYSDGQDGDMSKAVEALYYKQVLNGTELVHAQADLLLQQLSLLCKTGLINLKLSSLNKIKEEIENGRL